MAEMHGLPWVAPYTKMRDYLDAMDATVVASPPPEQPAPIWIAANGPRLLALAGERLDGANTYLLPPAHTARARELLGPHKRLNVVLPCCLTEQPPPLHLQSLPGCSATKATTPLLGPL